MPKFKIGDKVRCIPGFQSKDSFGPKYGGHGYVENEEFIIKKITGDHKDKTIVYWEDKGGVFPMAVELVEKLTYKKLKLDL